MRNHINIKPIILLVALSLALAACGGGGGGDDDDDDPNPITNFAPTLTVVATLTGAAPGEPFDVTYPILAAAADEADADSDPVAFRVESVITGSLQQGGGAVTPGASLLDASSQPFVFTHGATGLVDAFTVVAHDGQAASSPPVTVRIDVRAPSPLQPSWIGGTAVASRWTTTGVPTSGPGDGAFDTPFSVATGSGAIFVADSANHRVTKFDATSGAFIGWVGNVDQTPIGGAAGCAQAAFGDATPGWCQGGSALRTGGDWTLNSPSYVILRDGVLWVGHNSGVNKYDADSGAFIERIWDNATSSIGFDSDYAYLAERFDHRIRRIALADGADGGWLGRVGPNDPADIPTSCAGGAPPAVDQPTHDWCFGGNAAAGSGDGELSGPGGLVVFEETPGDHKLIVADTANHRLVKLDADTGEFIGWIGEVGAIAPALGGDCAGQAVGYVAQGWCQGGRTRQGLDSDGGLWAMGGTHLAAGKVYQADGYSLLRYDAASGAFEGWIGVIGYLPPDSCLNGIPSPSDGVPTGSWCIGGVSSGDFNGGFGGLGNVFGAAVDGNRLYVVDGGNHRIHVFDTASGVPVEWLGGLASAVDGWSTSDFPGPSPGNLDGMMEYPSVIGLDAARDALYVVASLRLTKWVASTGEYVGWSGRTTTAPTSCLGVDPATIPLPGPTNAWCKGGTAATGDGDGEYSGGDGIAITADYVYLADSRGRIQRFTHEGAFAGWIGTIVSRVPDSPPTCAAASIGDFTPDWCFGGFGRLERGAIAVSGDTMYSASWFSGSIHKITITDGAVSYDGWTGRVGPDPGDVPTSCAGGGTPGVNEATNDWCVGGASAPGDGDGMFDNAISVTVDADGNLYVVSNFHRLSKLDPGGAFVGWTGGIGTSPTGPPGPCVGATGTTPGWCTGGTASAGFGDEGLRNARHVAWDAGGGGRLYVADWSNQSVKRYNAISGAPLGWAGEVEITPDGGDPGCDTAARGEITPGWCLGGFARATRKNGSMAPYSIGVDTTRIYVGDTEFHRVTRLVKEP